jgi:hypothetical protein
LGRRGSWVLGWWKARNSSYGRIHTRVLKLNGPFLGWWCGCIQPCIVTTLGTMCIKPLYGWLIWVSPCLTTPNLTFRTRNTEDKSYQGRRACATNITLYAKHMTRIPPWFCTK